MRPYDNDQRREVINTRQLFESWRESRARARQQRGSMVWSTTKDISYLLKSVYPESGGVRRQVSLGPRSAETEKLKRDFDTARAATRQRLATLAARMERQSSVNRAVGLGRFPLLPARILQRLNEAGLLGQSLRVVGTHAIFAYEAVAGVFTESDIASTQDMDLSCDSRMRLRFIATEDQSTANLMSILKKVDRSFQAQPHAFRASNDEGYLIDLIKLLREPVSALDQTRLSADGDDLSAVEIEGLIWLENAPAFEAIVIDERGKPVRIVTVDPRVFAAHKLWLSRRSSRDPLQRRRDEAQARVVARLTVEHFQHLSYRMSALRMLPREVVEAARPLFLP